MLTRLLLALCLLVGCNSPGTMPIEEEPEAAIDTIEAPPPAPPPAPAAPACTGKGGAPGDTTITLHVGARAREAILHAPPSYDPARPLPLVLVLHPLLLDHVQMRDTVRMERFSDEGEGAGFLTLFPNGVDKSWNAGECCGTAREENVDDVGYIRELLEEVASTYCVDETRIFATGFSNGAFLSHRLGCELGDTLRAIVPVAGTLGIPEADCKRTTPLPVLAFHGTEDKLVPYGGGKPSGALGFLGRLLDTAGTFPSPATTDAFWAKHNGAAETTVSSFARGEVSCEQHEGAAPVTLCTVKGGGHQWPGTLDPFPVMGHATKDIDATEAAVKFFREHGL
ncbi:MAG: hypothetical protein KIT84_32930 [Labilithrix sp.]|nr:hypothetical protein [Labilithrix sp.]MCW5815880.1 hypothetical protein [Labilithrix sp.]